MADAGGDGGRTEAQHLVLPYVVSLQGTLQADGQEQRRGALVAAQQLNSLGGILGRQVEVEFLDDTSDPNAAAALAARLTEIGSPLVLGPTGSPAAAALRQSAPGTLFVSPSATSPVLDLQADGGTATDSFFFRTAPSDTLLAKGLALLASSGEQDVANGASGCLTLSIIYSDDDYGRPIADRVESLFKLFSRQITAKTPVPGTLQSPDTYAGIARSVASAEKNCQLVVASAEIGASYIRAFGDVEKEFSQIDFSKFQTFGSNAMRTDGFLKNALVNPADPASGSIADGVILLDAEAQGDTNSFSAFSTMFASLFPNDPVGRSANSYDAVIVSALALEAAGPNADVAAVRTALLNVSKLGEAKNPKAVDSALQSFRAGKDIDYVGASGSLDFDNQGQVLTDFLVWRVRAGKFENTSRYARSAVQ